MASVKQEIMKQTETERRRKVRVRLAELRKEIAEARRVRKGKLKEISALCARKRAALRNVCQLRRHLAKEGIRAKVDETQGEIKRVKIEDRKIRAWDRPPKWQPKIKRSTAKERCAEEDYVVQGDIDPSLVPVYERVKKHILATPKRSKTEAFLHWAEENPEEVLVMQSDAAERKLAKMIAEHERLERQQHRKRKPGDPSDVPF